MTDRSNKETLDALGTASQESQQAFIETLQELTYELQPEVQLNHFADKARYEATKVLYSALDTLDAAREGDPDARQKVLQVVGGAVSVLCLLRFRRRHKAKKRAREAAKAAAEAATAASQAAARAEHLAEQSETHAQRKRAAKKARKQQK